MRAQVGDLLIADGVESRRVCEIIRIHHADGSPPYVVRWLSDGHIALMFPGKHTTTGREQAEDDHMTVTGCSYALLADGTTAEIRPATPDDLDAADVRRALRRLEGRF